MLGGVSFRLNRNTTCKVFVRYNTKLKCPIAINQDHPENPREL